MYFGVQRPDVFSPPRDIVFKLFSTQTSAFLCLCAYATYNHALLHGQQESIDGLHFKVAALQKINNLIRDPNQRYSLDAYLAAATFLWFLQTFGNLTSRDFRVQFSGVKQILRARGGLESLRDHSLLDISSCWLFLLLSADNAASLRQILSTEPSLDRDTSLELQEISQASQELLRLLGDLQHLNEFPALYGSETSQINALRSLLFSRGTKVYHYLSEDFENLALPKRRGMKQSLQLACLLYFNLTLWEYRYSPKKISFFLSRLHALITEDHIHSIELLIWNLLRDLDGVPERRWAIIKMQQAADFLSPATRELVKMFLLLNLAARKAGDVSCPFPIDLYMGRVRADLGKYLML